MKRLTALLLALIMAMPLCLTATAEGEDILIPIPTPEEGKSFFEQVDPDREIYVSDNGTSHIVIYMQPVEVTSGYNLREGYTSYGTSNGYFPEVYNYQYDPVPNDTEHTGTHPLDITWLEGSENLRNKRAGSGLFCPMYKISYNTEKYTLEEFMSLFEGRKDVYFIEPVYADNEEDFIYTYISALGPPPTWYWHSVIYAVNTGIMNGFTADYDPYADGAEHLSFRPNDPITRAQFVQILYNMAGNGEKVDVEMPYEDVSEDDWYYDAMRWAYKNQLINGMNKYTMAPDTILNREMAATVLYRFADVFGYSTDVKCPKDTSDYVDMKDVSPWAQPPVAWAAESGLMNGWEIYSGCLYCGNVSVWAPKDTCTRAQIAKIAGDFYRYHNVYAQESGLTRAQFYDMLHNR
ncbi:MAG: S-layer homology domain-containing protein [Clostridia bacterium]|nr:S-layer homology domain-containing protein [Clostridia bacterium]